MPEARDIIRDLLAEHHCSAAERAYKEHEEGADRILTALSRAGLAVVPVEPTEAMVDAPRPLILFYGQPKANFTLGQHIDSGVRKVRLTDDERSLNYVNKATLAALMWRAMVDAALPPLASGGG